jgi:ATP-dependent protease HslVU (ClpYQ) ATPase subunit
MKIFNSIEEAMDFLRQHEALDLIKIEEELKINKGAKIENIGLVLIDELNILD